MFFCVSGYLSYLHGYNEHSINVSHIRIMGMLHYALDTMPLELLRWLIPLSKWYKRFVRCKAALFKICSQAAVMPKSLFHLSCELIKEQIGRSWVIGGIGQLWIPKARKDINGPTWKGNAYYSQRLRDFEGGFSGTVIVVRKGISVEPLLSRLTLFAKQSSTEKF